MNKLTLFLVVLITACSSLGINKSPENAPLLTVANEPVYMDEFIYAFNKNRPADSVAAKASISEYLDLYIKFKLKVTEAKARQMDTTSEFRNEYASYINQLDNSYLQTSNDTESLIAEAYERLKIEVRASHILFNVSKTGTSADTLVAYNKALMVKDSLNNGASFEDLAMVYSDDPSAKQNKGDLGYFTVFQMVYPFETAAYSTLPGQISMPTRTEFGYHLIKVVDKKPNEGQVKVAHIMIRKRDDARDKAFSIYDQLTAGANWQETCKQYSEDGQSAGNGGILAPFSRRQIVAAFADAAFSLTEVDEISDPVETPYGWHIIKLIQKIPVGDFETNHYKLRAQVKRDSRAQLSKQKMIVRLTEENNLAEETQNIQLVTKPENHTYLKNRWLFEEDSMVNMVLFKIQDDPYYAKGLFAYINRSAQQKNNRGYLQSQFIGYKEESLINYEKAHLSEKYDDYKYLKQEFYDGILLFSIMENEVWAKAAKDSVGLAAYYKQHKNDFIDSTRLSVAIFSGDNHTIIDSIAAKLPDSQAYKSLSNKEKEELLAQYNGTTQLSLQLDSGEFVIAQHPVLQNLSLPYSVGIVNAENKWHYVIPLRNPNDPLPMEEVKGRLIAEYQVVLEERWLVELNKTYSVDVNEAVLKKVNKKLEKF